MIKVVTFFLIGMVILAIFGKLRFPGKKRLSALKCPDCGRYRLGRADCDCKQG
jgi:hypothetical protein